MDLFINLLSAIVGGWIVALYQGELAARTAKGNRLREVYYPMLAATGKAESFALRRDDDLFEENGTMTVTEREAERRLLTETLDHLDKAAESARWLEFESDKVAVHLRHSLLALQALLRSYQNALDPSDNRRTNVMNRKWSNAEKEKIAKVCVSLRFFLIEHIRELERSPVKDIEKRLKRHYNRLRTRLKRERLWWRVRFAVWKKGKRLKTIQRQLAHSPTPNEPRSDR